MVWFHCFSPIRGRGMFAKQGAYIFVLLVLGLLAPQANAAMLINGYTPERHDRFYSYYTGMDGDFIGEDYDWSGVGIFWRESDIYPGNYYPRWVTMISDQYFLTAKHTYLAGGSKVTFYADNSLDNPIEYVVESSTLAYFGDLALGKLTTPISPADNITHYPIFEFANQKYNYGDYKGMSFLAYGYGGDYPNPDTEYNPRVGGNQIDKIENRTDNYSLTAKAMIYDYDSGVSDECWLDLGDSGAPSFVAYNGELAIVGIHWITSGTHENPIESGDSFIPLYTNIAGPNNDLSEKADIDILSPLGGDANLDGYVDEADATILTSNWQRRNNVYWKNGDFNGDWCVDEIDATIMATNWHRWAGTPAVVATATPEPAGVVLLLSGLALIFARRLRRAR